MTNDPGKRMTLEVIDTDLIADEVRELTLAAPDRSPLPAWQPGAHIELTLPSGLTRHYSLCGDPADRHSYTVAVLREAQGRGGSRELHETAAVGAVFEVGAPKNDFPLVEAESYLFIGGGIGITPLLPMIDEVARRGKQWTLVYGGRTRTSMAYVNRISGAGERVDQWVECERGYPDLPTILSKAPSGTVVYTCGPGAMIDAVRAEFGNHAHLADLHVERFAASGPVDTTGDSFEVELRRTGETFIVGEGETILDAVKELVPSHPFSCEEGYCGECETRVLEGEPDHRDEYLTEEEQANGDVMMICVGRCKGAKLVLDL